MSLTRKMLKGMSLTDEQIDTIIEAHADVVNSLKDERDNYKDELDKLKEEKGKSKSELDGLKEEAEKLKETVKENAEKLKELEELKAKSAESETKFNELKKEYDDYKSSQSAIAEKNAKETAYKEMLKATGVSEKRIASVMRVTNLDDIKLDKDGKLKDEEKIVENVKAEWADFIDTKRTEGADVKKPPASTVGKLTKEDILKIKDTSERQAAIAENHELFGF